MIDSLVVINRWCFLVIVFTSAHRIWQSAWDSGRTRVSAILRVQSGDRCPPP